jgi:hypothetical protein
LLVLTPKNASANVMSTSTKPTVNISGSRNVDSVSSTNTSRNDSR